MTLGTPLAFRNFPRQKASAGGLAERLRSGLQIGPDFPLNQRTSIFSSGGQSENALATAELTGGPDRSATGAAFKRKSLETAMGALTSRQWVTRAFGNFSAALLLSACTPPPGDCLLVDHVVFSCEEFGL